MIRNGHLIDPLQGIDGPADLAFRDGKVAAVAPSLDSASAVKVHDAAGAYVVPGLIDLHTHVYRSANHLGVDADLVARVSGMTTAVDAGSAGANNIAGLFDLVRPGTAVRLLAFLNLSAPGIFSEEFGEAEDLRLLNLAGCAAMARNRPADIVGIKIRLGASTSGVLGAMPLHMAIRAAEMAGDLPVMAHVGSMMPPRLEDVVDALRPGDILTHCCTPRLNSPLTPKGLLRDCMNMAHARGVIFDVGHGSNSFGFDVARAMIEFGVAPDVISSDVHVYSIDGPAHDILVTMSKFLCLGLPLTDVVRAATASPAAVIRRTDLGTLRIGSVGDAALLSIKRGRVTFVDSIGSQLSADRRLVAEAVILNGKLWHQGKGEADGR